MSNLEKIAILQTIDEKWREHLRVMDDLKEGIHLRAYGQKDPLLEYKGEAFKLFMELVHDINKESVSLAFKYFPRIAQRSVRSQGSQRKQPPTDAENLPRLRRSNVTNNSSLQYQKSSEIPAYLTGRQGSQEGQPDSEVAAIKTFKKTEKTVGRNEPCPCGSGKKYKNCHGRME
jgi:preprotein translocase subunit SecA